MSTTALSVITLLELFFGFFLGADLARPNPTGPTGTTWIVVVAVVVLSQLGAHGSLRHAPARFGLQRSLLLAQAPLFLALALGFVAYA